MPYRLIERSGGSLWLKLLLARGEPKFPGVRNGSSQKCKKFADYSKKVAEKFGGFEYYLYLCNIVARLEEKQLPRTKENGQRTRLKS